MTLPPGWDIAAIGDCLRPPPRSSTRAVPTGEMLTTGKYPVVDQGQSFIAGWTNDESAVLADSLPVVVFGDHTRTVKYVDFAFARGADGTQLLRPSAHIDPRFFYFACTATELPARGYNRHFGLLKARHIPLPPLEEQVAMSGCLRALEVLGQRIDVQVEACSALAEIARAQLFSAGLRGEMQKETEIGFVPESWEVRRLGDVAKIVSGGTPSRAIASYWTHATIPWVKTTEVRYSTITETEELISAEGLESSTAKLLPIGTLLLAMYGQGVTRGKVALLGIEAACNQACAAVLPPREALNQRFLYHFMVSQYDAIRQLAHGGQQQNLNLEIVRDLRILVPESLDEQHEIVDILDTLDRKIDLHRRKRALLEELFKTLLQQLMSGAIRVADLDLSALPQPVAS